MITTPCERPLPTSQAGNQPFVCRIKEAGRTVLAEIVGPVDVQYSPRLLCQLDAYRATAHRVVLDLRKADYIDSSGVRALLSLHQDLEAASGELRLVVEPGSRVERVLKLLQLTDMFHTYHSAAEAWDRAHTAA